MHELVRSFFLALIRSLVLLLVGGQSRILHQKILVLSRVVELARIAGHLNIGLIVRRALFTRQRPWLQLCGLELVVFKLYLVAEFL